VSTRSDARIETIWLKTGRRGPMQRVPEATLIEGVGLDGNAERGGRRQVTLLDADAWERATGELGIPVDPSARRANFLVRGIDLAHSVDQVLRLGSCTVRIRGETRPCGRMDEAAMGLRERLEPEWRGGVYATVVEGGPIVVGDPVAWV
jgi:MOSC domain-containing protein YiiM